LKDGSPDGAADDAELVAAEDPAVVADEEAALVPPLPPSTAGF
jgi:hypothetical protein